MTDKCVAHMEDFTKSTRRAVRQLEHGRFEHKQACRVACWM